MNVLRRFPSGLLMLLAVTALTGCSIWSRESTGKPDTVPLSNKVVAQTVIMSALENLDIPDGDDTPVRLSVVNLSPADELINEIIPGYLLNKGYRLTDTNGSVSEIHFSVDTLYIAMNYRHQENSGKLITRSSETHISAVITDTYGRSKVYDGQGTFQDDIPVSMAMYLDSNEPYVSDDGQFRNRMKPVIFGAVLTFFLWYLYSFRG